jgi:phosphosulfolactate synthase
MPLCFQELGIPQREKKPRKNGWTIIVDGLDSGFMGLRQLDDWIQVAGPYVDFVKQGWLISTLLPMCFVQEKNELLRRNHIQSFPGGMLLETAWAKGKYEKCLDEIAILKFSAVEISDSVTPLSVRQKTEMIQKALRLKFTVIAEVGKKGENLSKSMIEESQKFIEAGAVKVIVESGGIENMIEGRNVDDLQAILEGISEKLGQEKVIFEVPYGHSFPQINPVVSWFVKRFGPDVNLANVEANHILAVETVRRRICFGEGFQIP